MACLADGGREQSEDEKQGEPEGEGEHRCYTCVTTTHDCESVGHHIEQDVDDPAVAERKGEAR